MYGTKASVSGSQSTVYYSGVSLAQCAVDGESATAIAKAVVILLRNDFASDFVGFVQHMPGHWFSIKHHTCSDDFSRIDSLG